MLSFVPAPISCYPRSSADCTPSPSMTAAAPPIRSIYLWGSYFEDSFLGDSLDQNSPGHNSLDRSQAQADDRCADNGARNRDLRPSAAVAEGTRAADQERPSAAYWFAGGSLAHPHRCDG